MWGTGVADGRPTERSAGSAAPPGTGKPGGPPGATPGEANRRVFYELVGLDLRVAVSDTRECRMTVVAGT